MNLLINEKIIFKTLFNNNASCLSSSLVLLLYEILTSRVYNNIQHNINLWHDRFTSHVDNRVLLRIVVPALVDLLFRFGHGTRIVIVLKPNTRSVVICKYCARVCLYHYYITRYYMGALHLGCIFDRMGWNSFWPTSTWAASPWSWVVWTDPRATCT